MDPQLSAMIALAGALGGGLVTLATRSLQQRSNGNGLKDLRDTVLGAAERNLAVLTRLEVLLTRIEGLAQAHIEAHHQDRRQVSGR